MGVCQTDVGGPAVPGPRLGVASCRRASWVAGGGAAQQLGPRPCPSSGGTELLALSARGRLMTCRLEQRPEAPWPASGTAGDTGRKIKDLLCGIGTVSER